MLFAFFVYEEMHARILGPEGRDIFSPGREPGEKAKSNERPEGLG